MPIYDENGEEMEGALPPDEAKALKEELEAKAQELKEKSERLQGLESKDMNFRRLEQMTEAEKSKLTEKETELMKRQEALEDQQRSFENKQIESIKEYAIKNLVGEDAELREKILEKYKSIAGEAKTPEEISERVADAFAMARRKNESINPLAAVMGVPGSAPKQKSGNFADTDAGKALAKELGMSFVNEKKN